MLKNIFQYRKFYTFVQKFLILRIGVTATHRRLLRGIILSLYNQLRMRYLYIFSTIFFTVYGQIILKWRIEKLGWVMSDGNFRAKVICYLRLLFDPFILSGFVSAFIASIFWTMAMSKFEITTAYPFMSLSPVIVFIIGIWLLGETFTIGKVIGLVLIILGTIVTVKF
jgi:undecaprenyl phosphate-alpha-L-ara4N flippase subunit ArnF